MTTIMHGLRDAAGSMLSRWAAIAAAVQLTFGPLHTAAHASQQTPHTPQDAAVPADVQPPSAHVAPPSQRSMAQPALSELLASLHAVYKTMNPPLTLGELVFGMQVLVKRHAERVDTHREDLEGHTVADKTLVHQLLDMLDVAQSAYRRDPKSAAAHCKLKLQHIVSWQPESSYLQPGHYVAIDHMQQQVVVVIRGTRFLSDLLIDLTSAHPLGEGHTHWGMHQAALWLIHREAALIQGLLSQHHGYSLHLVGHSLGGGIASLIAYMAHNDDHVKAILLPPHMRGGRPGEHVQAVCFAPPCIMSKDLAESCRPYVTSIIHAADLVPRLNALTLAGIRAELQETDWVGHMRSQMSQGSQLLQGAGHTYITTGLQQLAGALLPQSISRNLESSMQALMAKGVTPRQAALQLLDGVLTEPMRSYVMPRLSQPDSAGATLAAAPPPAPPGGQAGAPPAGGSDDRGGEARGASGLAVNELMRRLLHPASKKNHASDAHSAAASTTAGDTPGRGAQEAAAGTTAQVTPVRGATGATGPSSEPDLSSWAAAGVETAEVVSQRIRGLSLPSSARDALVGFFSTANTAEVMRMTGLMLSGSGSRKGGQLTSSSEQGAASAGQHQEGGAAGQSQVVTVSGPMLYPAGKLYYLRRQSSRRGDDGEQEPVPVPAIEDAHQLQHSHRHEQLPPISRRPQEPYALIDVPPDAAYFQHALLTGQALRDHRSRAYRAGLLGVLQGLDG